MLNDVTKDKRSQSDGGDGVQEHGGGLDHAADGAGLIHQILDSAAVVRVGIDPLLRFYAALPTSVVSVAKDLFSTLHWFLRPTTCNTYCGHAAMCAKQNGFAEGRRTCTHE